MLSTTSPRRQLLDYLCARPMTNSRLTQLVVAFAITGVPSVADAQRSTTTQSLTAEQVRNVDALVTRHMSARRIPGAAIGIVRGGHLAFTKSYGTANLEIDTPMSDASVFQIASVTKPFTASAIMTLAASGKLRLDDSVGKFISQAPPSWSGLTVRHLLTHTAGIAPGAIVRVGADGRITMREGIPLLDIPAALALRSIAESPVLFQPGARAMYCDACYVLLGGVIERASGQRYQEFMQSQVFQPLQMSTAGILDRWRIVRGAVPVYTLRNGEIAPWGRDSRYELNSFAGIIATIADVAKWDIALRAGRVVPREALEEMWTPAKLASGEPVILFGDYYGLGWTLGEVRGHRTAEHAGASGTFLLHFIDRDLTVITLTNLDGPSGSQPAVLARGIAGIVDSVFLPVSQVAPRADPVPATTRAIREMLGDMAAERASTMMTAGQRTFYESLPSPARAEDAALLRTLSELTFVARDTLTARSWLRFGDAVTHIAHYSGLLSGRRFVFSFWLTGNGKVAYFRFSPA